MNLGTFTKNFYKGQIKASNCLLGQVFIREESQAVHPRILFTGFHDFLCYKGKERENQTYRTIDKQNLQAHASLYEGKLC